MGLIRRLTDYLYEKDIEVHIYKDRVNVVNYIEIPDFSNTKITIKHQNGSVIITGSKLVVSKLLNDEILISGDIKHIELG